VVIHRYNSAVFSTLATTEYAVVVAAPEFLDGGAWNVTDYNNPDYSPSYSDVAAILTNATTNKNNRFTRFNKTDCIKAYSVEFLSARKDVIVISTNHNSTNSIFYSMVLGTYAAANFTSALCGGYTCTAILAQPGGTDDPGDIDYCLSQEIDEECKLQFSLYIMITVILCNLVKLVIMSLTIWKHLSPPLVTLGDAVSSFLEAPDKSTEGMCVITKADILEGAWKEQRTPKAHPLVREFWFSAVSWKRWLICNGS
jgi:hypothetical protein